MSVSMSPLLLAGECSNSWEADGHANKQRMGNRLLKARTFFSQKTILAEKKCLRKVAKYFKIFLLLSQVEWAHHVNVGY